MEKSKKKEKYGRTQSGSEGSGSKGNEKSEDEVEIRDYGDGKKYS